MSQYAIATATPEELRVLLASALRTHPQISDINFTPGCLPQIEVSGELQSVALGDWNDELTDLDTKLLAEAIIGTDARLIQSLEETGAADCALELGNGTRFRANVFRARGAHSIVLRVLPSKVPSLEQFQLPKILEEIPTLHDGLVLVCGATGSGKSTTLAAIIDRINATRAVHIVTLEDPVEFVHTHKKATLNQREFGLDFFRFSDGLRSALRQAPKVILVGELRDRETMEIALKAAETGHLVLSTLHTIRAGDAIHRISGMFDADERALGRSRLAHVLRYVVAQRLLPKKDGGRVAALEIMGSNLRVRGLIENGETEDNTFAHVITDNRPRGWQTFDEHIAEHYAQALITEEIASSYASDRSVMQSEIDRNKARRGESTSDIGELTMDTPRKLKR